MAAGVGVGTAVGGSGVALGVGIDVGVDGRGVGTTWDMPHPTESSKDNVMTVACSNTLF